MLQLYSKYEYHVFQMGLLAGIMKFEMNLLCSIARNIICTRLFHGKMHSDWFNRIEILQGRWQHGKKWDTLIPVDLKRLFVSGTHMSRWSQKG
jgi:hypothetical protein